MKNHFPKQGKLFMGTYSSHYRILFRTLKRESKRKSMSKHILFLFLVPSDSEGFFHSDEVCQEKRSVGGSGLPLLSHPFLLLAHSWTCGEIVHPEAAQKGIRSGRSLGFKLWSSHSKHKHRQLSFLHCLLSDNKGYQMK